MLYFPHVEQRSSNGRRACPGRAGLAIHGWLPSSALRPAELGQDRRGSEDARRVAGFPAARGCAVRGSGLSALVGALVGDPVVQTVMALVLGVLVFSGLVWWSRRHPDEDDLV